MKKINLKETPEWKIFSEKCPEKAQALQPFLNDSLFTEKIKELKIDLVKTQSWEDAACLRDLEKVSQLYLHTDPFLGEIRLKKVGETSMHVHGESRVDSLFMDRRGGIYIQTWATTGTYGDNPIQYLRPEIVELISKSYFNSK